MFFSSLSTLNRMQYEISFQYLDYCMIISLNSMKCTILISCSISKSAVQSYAYCLSKEEKNPHCYTLLTSFHRLKHCVRVRQLRSHAIALSLPSITPLLHIPQHSYKPSTKSRPSCCQTLTNDLRCSELFYKQIPIHTFIYCPTGNTICRDMHAVYMT